MTDTAKAATTNTPTKAGAGSASTAARTPAEPSILSRVAAARYAQTAEGTQTHVPIAKARETLAKSASEGHGDTAAQTVSIGLPEHGPGAQAQSQEQTSSRPQVDASANASAARTVATAGSKANGVTAPRTGLPSAPANALAGRAYRPAPPTTKVPDPASCPVPSEAMCSGAQTSGTAKPGVGPQAATAKPRQAGIEVQPSRSDNATRILPDRKGESRSAPPKDELPRGAQESGLPKSPVPMRPRTGYPVTDAQTPVLNEAPRATPQNQASSPQPRGSRPVQTGEGPWVRSAGAQVSPSLQTPRQARPAASPASGASPLPSTTPLPRSTSPHPRATPSSTAASQQRPSPPPSVAPDLLARRSAALLLRVSGGRVRTTSTFIIGGAAAVTIAPVPVDDDCHRARSSRHATVLPARGPRHHPGSSQHRGCPRPRTHEAFADVPAGHDRRTTARHRLSRTERRPVPTSRHLGKPCGHRADQAPSNACQGRRLRRAQRRSRSEEAESSGAEPRRESSPGARVLPTHRAAQERRTRFLASGQPAGAVEATADRGHLRGNRQAERAC